MILAIVLMVIGVLLSAFFSGSETGFYRVTRVRLVMDAMSGQWIARCLLWLVRFPSVVVATVLIGNNIANYLVSLGLLLFGKQLLSESGGQLQALIPVLATPFLFIYGELLPKYLYYHAPYYLATRGAPFLVLCAAIFLPISIVVMGLDALWQRLLGGESVRTRFSLERQELQRVLMEGQEAGLLLPIQREMAQNMFTYGVRPVRHFAIPLRAIPLVEQGASLSEILESATRNKQKYVGVLAESGSELTGCYQVSDVLLSQPDGAPAMAPVCRIKATESSIQALIQLQSRHSPLAQIFDDRQGLLGVVTRERLIALLLPEE